MIWGVSEKVGFTPKSSILIGFSIISTIHFGVPQFFGNTHIIVGVIYTCFYGWRSPSNSNLTLRQRPQKFLSGLCGSHCG